MTTSGLPWSTATGRMVLEGLPHLKLIVCNGRTSNVIDHDARIERGILLCGTAETGPGTALSLPGPETLGGLPSPSVTPGTGARRRTRLGGAARDDDVFRAGRLSAVVGDRLQGERAGE